MMLTPEIDPRGFSSALCKCDICGRETHERAKHETRGSQVRNLTEGQVLMKLRSKGWTYIKQTLRCPSCEDARKATDKPPVIENAMTEKLKTLKIVTPQQIEPTRDQKRQINALLTSVYDTSAGRYTGKETDATVADTLGAEFKVDWVTQIREEYFGPDGNAVEMAEIAAEIAEVRAEITKAFERSAEAQKAVMALNDRLDKVVARLDAITVVRK